MNEVQKMIHRYAWLATGVEREQAAGRPIPPQVQNEMNRLYSRAQAMLSPAEQQQALQSVETMMAQFHHQAEAQSAHRAATDKQFYGDKLAKDLTGYTADQLEHAKRGEKVPVKGAKFRPDHVRQRIEGILGNLGQKDLSFAKFQKLADKYNEAKSVRGAEAAKAHLSRFGDKANEMADFIEGYTKSGVDMAVGLTEKRGYTKDHYEETSEDSQMRAQIADAWAREAAHDEDAFDSIVTQVDPAYLEDEHRTGDVARAWQEVEARDAQNERSNYTPPQYDEAELEESNEAYGT